MNDELKPPSCASATEAATSAEASEASKTASAASTEATEAASVTIAVVGPDVAAIVGRWEEGAAGVRAATAAGIGVFLAEVDDDDDQDDNKEDGQNHICSIRAVVIESLHFDFAGG